MHLIVLVESFFLSDQGDETQREYFFAFLVTVYCTVSMI